MKPALALPAVNFFMADVGGGLGAFLSTWLAPLAVVGLFQVANSAMLPLLGQRIVAEGSQNATAWVSACAIVAQLTIVPAALAAGRLSDRLGRRWLLIAVCGVVVARCGLAASAASNWWLVPVQMLDGVAAAP